VVPFWGCDFLREIYELLAGDGRAAGEDEMMTDERAKRTRRDAEDQLKNHLDQLIQRNRIPGIQYVMTDAHGVTFEYYGGRRDLGHDLPVEADTTFMASSSTKVITAAAALQLVEHDHLKLDDPLSTYYSEHPYGDKVTVRHMLTHTSGIPNPLPLKWLHPVEDHDSFDEDRALKEVMRRSPKLLFEPGERYSYSNLAYWLLGKVIQAASGRNYCDYLNENIFAPLCISSNELSCRVPRLSRHARGYQPKYTLLGLFLYLMMDRSLISAGHGARFRLRPVYMNGSAYGGLVGTARGFAKFLQDQLRPQPRLFTSATRSLFFSHQKTSRGLETNMTLGWRIGRLSDVLYYGKPGGGPGFQSNVRVYPERGIATAWLMNQTAASERPIARFTDALDSNFLE
jgi:D-alanyl-D-alanine carboxypeptidase